jgi:hypothetical protein
MVKNDESADVNEDLKYSLSTIQQTNDKAKLCDNGFICYLLFSNGRRVF